jgi:hypothetical protein
MTSQRVIACLGCLFGLACARETRPPALEVAGSAAIDLRSQRLGNRIAYIPPQCFTRLSDGPELRVQNPCYVCHADAPEPNMASQPELQLAYDFPQVQAGWSVQNPWHNGFRDRRGEIAAISDTELQAYVAQDNYAGKLLPRLVQLPAAWDVDRNGHWDGYRPDAHFAFDAQGFDRAPDGTPTGYRVFAYYPLPGAFMPANGSFDDVLIRLPRAFRTAQDGREDLGIYAVNLAILESLIRRADVAIDLADERALGVDLDRDGQLSAATVVRYTYRPREPESMSYVGAARGQRLSPGLFPQGTEFLHSVRYLRVDERGALSAAPRMKELRYARKQRWVGWAELADGAQREAKEAALNPDRPEQFAGDAERGLHNALGWVYQGFIEDARGELRPQSYEETLSCMGCHGGLSATEDGSFAFARKLQTGPAHGWFALRWGEGIALPDPLRQDGEPEYASYLSSNREADGYRSNGEIRARFFDAAGMPLMAAFAELSHDVSTLLLPSAERALLLDKAYWLIVREQSFTAGRDAVIAPHTRVYRELTPGTPTGIQHAEPAPRLKP